jgi:energy-coupling factor transporter ATP-binding protein EcfA2
MLAKIILSNYRCFEKHEISFRELSIAVGKNNAGKSTFIEALRLISIVMTRNLNFKPVPRWLDEDLPPRSKGVIPAISSLRFTVQNLFHQFNDPPAKIEAIFEDGKSIVIYIGEEAKLFAFYYDINGKMIKAKPALKSAEFVPIYILPQIGPLATEERVLSYDYVRSNLSSHLSSIHFRNQIKYFYGDFPNFRTVAEANWPGLHIRELDGRSLQKEGLLTLIVHDGDFASEIGWMGHGLQMWLQTMWFLSRVPTEATIILDEPDVYMHADLQRKLIRFLRDRYRQVVVATHSIEIMSEVEPEEILIVNKRRDRSEYAPSLPAIQKVVYQLGSIHNLGLSRLWETRKLLLVEGKDIRILKRVQNLLYPGSIHPFDAIPNSAIGGWSGWNKVMGTNMVLKNGFNQAISVYCLLDSDYHLDEEILERKANAKKGNINLHIWNRKEIENYFLIPEAIHRIISRKHFVDLKDVENVMHDIVRSIMEVALNGYLDEISNVNRRLSASSALKRANEMVERKLKIDSVGPISGKEVLSKLSFWSQNRFNVSFNAVTVAAEAKISELSPELLQIIEAIEHCKEF